MMNLFENLQNIKENVTKLSNKELIKKYVNKLSDEDKEEYDVKNILTNLNSLSEDDNNVEDLAIAIQDALLDNDVEIEPANDGTSDWLIYNESLLKEYNSNITTSDEIWNEMKRYTDEAYVSFNDLFNCFSIDDLQDLYDFLSSEYEDEELTPYKGKLNNITELWNEMSELLDDEKVSYTNLFNCFSFDKLKELYDFISSNYSELDDYDEEFENNQLVESDDFSDEDLIRIRKMADHIEEYAKTLVSYVNKYDDIMPSIVRKIKKVYSSMPDISEIKESTSGIGSAYTTKSIDIKPE